MCIAPRQMADGTYVRCHKCWQCDADRVNDWVGRCIAETKTSVAAHAITLTYGRKVRNAETGKWEPALYGDSDHPNAAVLTYSDVQKYLKKLRKHGYPCRYFITGEYGSRKGRAHWHAIIFWQKAVPPHELRVRFDEPMWEHGLSYWDNPAYEEFRYNCKYILKGMGEAERQGHLSMSKKPLIGAEYFRRMARDYAKQGLAPKDGYYTFPEALRKNGERVQFQLMGAAKALFIDAWAEAWPEFNPGRPLAYSEYTAAHLDPDKGEGYTLDLMPKRRLERPNRDLCVLLQRRIREAVEPDALFMDRENLSWSFRQSNGDIWSWRYDEEKETWLWLPKGVAKTMRAERTAWREATEAASQTDTPWLIVPGRKPKPRAPSSGNRPSSNRPN